MIFWCQDGELSAEYQFICHNELVLLSLIMQKLFCVPEHVVAKKLIRFTPFYDCPVLLLIFNSACHWSPALALSSNREQKRKKLNLEKTI